MQPSRTTPTALRVVAILFLIWGLLACVEVIDAALEGRLHLAFGVLQIPVCFGLLRHRPGWRIVALVFVWFGFVFLAVTAVLSLMAPLEGRVEVLGKPVGSIPGWVVALACLPVFCLELWAYLVLMRRDVKALFTA